jgi:hypothetical protein
MMLKGEQKGQRFAAPFAWVKSFRVLYGVMLTFCLRLSVLPSASWVMIST